MNTALDLPEEKLSAVSITENQLYEKLEFDSWEEFDQYRKGFEEGANAYGAGSAGVYLLADLQENGGDITPNDPRHPIIKRYLAGEES